MADLFLHLNGIMGESLDAKHLNEIEILEWSWQMSNEAGHKLGPRDASAKSKIDGIKIEKLYDKSSITLVQYLSLGTHIPDATITCRKNVDENTKLDYLIIKLKDVMVTSINWAGGPSRDGSPESLKLSFLQFDVQYTMQSNTGLKAGESNFRFDIPSHTAI